MLTVKCFSCAFLLRVVCKVFLSDQVRLEGRSSVVLASQRLRKLSVKVMQGA